MKTIEPVWSPSPERVERSNMNRFVRGLSAEVPSINSYEDLYEWSVTDAPAFWHQIWEFCDVICSRPSDTTVVGFDRMPGARWFPDARLSFAENLLRFRDDRDALISWNENGRQSRWTYAELYDEVSRLAQAMRTLGIQPGDRVVGFMPNLPQTVIAMLAASSLGAVWSSCSPDFGTKGVLDRFGQIEPKVLFTADAYLFSGKVHSCLERVAEVAAQIESLERIVVVPYQHPDPDLSFSELAVPWADFLAPFAAAEIDFVQLPFDHPLYIMYSSGTTGLPKCMVHSAGGTLLQHLKELVLHTDLTRDDRIFYFTTCGWMMWNWLVSSLAVGSTVLLYDGSPMKPKVDILFDLAQEEGMTVFGTSAKYLALVEKEGVRPKTTHDLSRIRAVLSTGSPLAPESYDYVYDQIGDDLQLSSISGGTDLISCFALGNPIRPVYRGELQTRGLGMKVEVFNDQGRPIVGDKGELVCTRPFPSMPIGFWNDADGSKYHQAYFDVFPNIWRHGDWAEITPRGGMIIYGRSDATLNPGGVRIGTAEIYRQVEQIEEVVESLVVGQQWQDDVRIVLFVRLRKGVTLTDELQDRIRKQVRANASPHHVPKRIVAVADIPRTRSGKITELAVRSIIHGRAVKNAEALANPEALELYRNLPELQV